MKPFEQMTRAELIQRIQALEKGARSIRPRLEQERLLRDLQVHQVELETQNRELREAQIQLEISRDRYADLYDFAPIGYVTMDAKGLIHNMNLAAAELLEVERGRLIGVPLHLYVVPQDLALFREHFHQLNSGKGEVRCELRLKKRSSGKGYPVELRSRLQIGNTEERPLYRTAVFDIGARKATEQAVRDSENRLRAILDTAAEGIITIDEHGVIETFNEAAEKMFGRSAAETVGQNVRVLMASPHREQHDQYLANYRDTGVRKIIGIGREALGVRKDGSQFPLEIAVSEMRLGEDRKFTGVVRDISWRKKAEESLRASEAQFRSINEASPLGICMADLQGQCIYTNPCWQKMSGLSADQNLGDGWTKVLHPDDKRALANAWKQAIQNGQDLAWEFRLLRPDGEIRWVYSRSRPIPNSEGKPIGFVSVDEDITDRKRDDQRREMQYSVSRLLADSGPVAETVPRLLQVVAEGCDWSLGEFWEAHDPHNKLRMVSVWHKTDRKLSAFVRFSLKHSIPLFDGMPTSVMEFGQPVHIADIKNCSHFARKRAAVRSGLRSAIAFPVRAKKELMGVIAFLSPRPILPNDSLLRMFDSLGSQIGQYLEQKAAEGALREAHEFGKQIIGNAQAGILVCNPEGRLVVWNHFMEQLTGYSMKTVLGLRMDEFPLFTAADELQEMLAKAMRGACFDSPDLHFKSPEKEREGWLSARFAPLRDAGQQIIGVSIALRDITDRRRLETELLAISDRERERIGHDLHDGLGQQLTALEMKCFILQEQLEAAQITGNEGPLHEKAQQIGQGLRESIASIRFLARGLSPVGVKPEGLVNSLRQLARDSAVGNVECSFACSRVVPVTDAHVAGQLFRIAQEAVGNALKHSKSPSIQIRLSCARSKLQLQVKDEGRGMPPRFRSKSGMGLEVMRHRAQVIGASLVIDSRVGKGVCITCTVPLSFQRRATTQ